MKDACLPSERLFFELHPKQHGDREAAARWWQRIAGKGTPSPSYVAAFFEAAVVEPVGFADSRQALHTLVSLIMNAAQEGGMSKAEAKRIHAKIGNAVYTNGSPKCDCGLILQVVAWVNVLKRSDKELTKRVNQILRAKAA